MPCVLVLARVTRAAGGSSLRVGQGTRPLSVGVECVARRPRHIRAGLLCLTGWAVARQPRRRAPLPPWAMHVHPPTQCKLQLSLVTHTVASDHGSSTPDDASRRTLTRGVAPASHLRADARTAAGVAEVRRGTNAGQATADSAHRDGRSMTLRASDASGQSLAFPHTIARRRDRRRQTARRLRWQQCQ